ncbi:GNAT family N-acetyltransferase [[Clostridium] dakarense]|uniref:GNAT family N-acetyltransferase n=1 Tax=Faecalimicrobium dakarense TaxID=1301100 RepID=UPI0004B0446A|nr:GNAT family N-acetyltransferase [[Clostridium] dakarense]
MDHRIKSEIRSIKLVKREEINIYFEFDDFYIDLVDNKDLTDIVDIYNSNKLFLINHVGNENVTLEWVARELDIMKNEGFYSCKVIQKKSNSTVGLIDFKLDKETYLSILMINNKYRGNGIGTIIYESLESYIKSFGSTSIRIDVVENYDKHVFDFWIKNGFKSMENITLNWNGKILPAIIMKKIL